MSGKEVWRTPLEDPGQIISGLSATPARVYVAAGERLLVLDAQNGKILRGRSDGGRSASAVVRSQVHHADK